MKPDWLIVANAAHARLLQQEPGAPMTVLQAFEHPASRLHSSELGDAERGREATDRSFGGAAYEAHIEPQRKEHLHFARELAAVLEQGAQQGRYHRIHVFASSPFLGELKAQLGTATQRLVAGTHDLDLSALALSEIEQRVQHVLAGER